MMSLINKQSYRGRLIFNRRQFIRGAAAGFGVAALSSLLRGEETTTNKPNVLIIQPDQHRGTIMGCAGDEQVKTPNLDALAAEGIRFSNCISSSPVCSPTRGSFQTGLYPHTHGVVMNNILLDPEYTTIAEIFSSAGYATGYIGKWHLDGGIPADKPGGFIEQGPRRQGWQEWHGYERKHEYFDVWKYDKNRNKVSVKGYDWEPRWHTDMALDFIKRNSKLSRPWLYYIAYGPPHKPEQCPEKFLSMYESDKFELAPDLAGRFPPEREQQLRRIMQVYYGQVTAIDFEVGRILDELKKSGIAENTIILYVSDHGDKLGSHCNPNKGKLRGKYAPYATAFRIPSIVRWPRRIQGGRVCDALVSSVDIAPTVLELAGLDIPSIMQGHSAADWCLKGNGRRAEALFLGLGSLRRGRLWRAVWDGRYIFSPLGYKILYDHKEDPHEMNNLFDSAEHKDVKKRMADLLISLSKETEDPMLEEVKKACKA